MICTINCPTQANDKWRVEISQPNPKLKGICCTHSSKQSRHERLDHIGQQQTQPNALVQQRVDENCHFSFFLNTNYNYVTGGGPHHKLPTLDKFETATKRVTWSNETTHPSSHLFCFTSSQKVSPPGGFWQRVWQRVCSLCGA